MFYKICAKKHQCVFSDNNNMQTDKLSDVGYWILEVGDNS